MLTKHTAPSKEVPYFPPGPTPAPAPAPSTVPRARCPPNKSAFREILSGAERAKGRGLSEPASELELPSLMRGAGGCAMSSVFLRWRSAKAVERTALGAMYSRPSTVP
eukprot:3908971-Pyramimonas_sp.AAC.1